MAAIVHIVVFQLVIPLSFWVDTDVSKEKSACIFRAEMSHFNPQDGGSMFNLQDYTLQTSTILTAFLTKNQR
jgi:hypothetical protein